MPRNRNVKILRVIIIAVLASIAGHIGVNFWERRLLQAELLDMKESLLFLQENIDDISNAYDALHKELKGISGLIGKKNPVMMNSMVACPNCNEKCKNCLDRRRLHDLVISEATNSKGKATNPDPNSRLQANSNNFPPKRTKNVRLERTTNATTQTQPQAFATSSSSLTKNRPKTTGIGGSFHETNYEDLGCKRYVYCDDETCCKDPSSNWKF